ARGAARSELRRSRPAAGARGVPRPDLGHAPRHPRRPHGERLADPPLHRSRCALRLRRDARLPPCAGRAAPRHVRGRVHARGRPLHLRGPARAHGPRGSRARRARRDRPRHRPQGREVRPPRRARPRAPRRGDRDVAQGGRGEARARVRRPRRPLRVLPAQAPDAGSDGEMKPLLHSLFAVAALVFAGRAGAEGKSPIVFDFEGDPTGAPPAGFEFGRTGQGAPGHWVVQAEEGVPSGAHVLVQTDTDAHDHPFPLAYAGPELADLRLSVRCRPVAGRVDQGCGLVFRLKDANNYYVARANALEDNVRLYHVVDGKRRQFAGWNGKVASGAWHELAIEAQGDHFQVFFDGARVIDAKDGTFAGAGKFGVWTKADSLIHFDDLTATPR